MDDILYLAVDITKKIQHFLQTFISISKVYKARIHKLYDIHFTSKIEIVVNVVVDVRNKKTTQFFG